MSLHQVQKLAISCVLAVDAGKNLADEMGKLDLSQLEAVERSSWRDIAYGTQRYSATLRAILARLLNKKVDNQEIDALLRIVLYQLIYTRNPQHVVVNEAVKLASKIAKGKYKALVNAIARRFLREQEHLLAQVTQSNNLEVKYNLPLWWIKYVQKDYPDDWQSILSASLMSPPLTLRVNQGKITPEQYLQLLSEHQLSAENLGNGAISLDKAVAVSSIPQFAEGYVSIQDYAAQQAAILLNPQKGEYILDACAAPGGKSGHILEMADCQLVAVDVDEKRLQKVEQNLNRLGLTAQLICADVVDIDVWHKGELFDAILADVPCTASGVIKRNPDIKWLRRPNDAKKMAESQVAILDCLWTNLKVGGRLLLATCSMFKEENDLQMSAFLGRHPDAILKIEQRLLLTDKQDGFYYALFEKE